MQREESLGYVVNHLARQFARALHERISPLGVVPGQFAQLLTLYEQDGMTQQELSELVGIEQPTMANTLSRMERDGLIERRPHPTDGRKRVIELTDKARDLESRLIAAAQAVNSQATAGLTHDDYADLVRLLRRIGDNLDFTD